MLPALSARQFILGNVECLLETTASGRMLISIPTLNLGLQLKVD
jgi:hypothetical protein